jgi:amino acid adenylation domain-containing protein
MRRLLQHYRTLLEGIVVSVDARIGELEILSEPERQQLLAEWNRTEAQYPLDKCVHELFEEQVRRSPQATAVVFEEEELSYGDLNARANRLAHYLRELGVQPDERVGICVERSFDMIVGLLAILKAGGAYVPLDPTYPTERLQYMLEDSAPILLLTQEHLQGLFGGIRDTVRVLDLSDAAPAWSSQPETNPDRNSVGLTSKHLAYVIYTSGSTGQPKGVMVPHRAINRLVLNNGYAKFEASDRIAFASNPAFDATTMEVWAPLLNGGCVVVIDQSVLLEPVRFGQTLKRHAVNILWLTVGLFNQYADALREEFSTLRYLIVGGDALDPRVIARVLDGNPPQHLLNGYGPTETTTFATTHEVTVVLEKARSIPIGRPIANTRIYVLDKWGEPVPMGVVGELYIGGAGVARGYLKRPELTAERFAADPFVEESGARMYRTGDLGRWLADGTIEYVGRNDNQVKIRGFRIELGEIEARLIDHAEVKEAVVIAREETGGEKRLLAYYTASGMGKAEEDSPSAEQLRSHLSAVVPEYMVPAAYVRMERLPLTANGKLDRKSLPAPEADAYAARVYEEPRSETERVLAGIWAELLMVERVGIHDNFFMIGGHSLKAARVVTRINESFNVDIPLRRMFELPTIAQLAEAIDQAVQRDRGDGKQSHALPAIRRWARKAAPLPTESDWNEEPGKNLR